MVEELSSVDVKVYTYKFLWKITKITVLSGFLMKKKPTVKALFLICTRDMNEPLPNPNCGGGVGLFVHSMFNRPGVGGAVL